MFYAEAGIALTPETQDQKLLESVATHLRTIHARALADGFLRRLAASRADVVINDDLRDDRIDWPALREAGFRVVKVAARAEVRVQRLAERNDLSVVKDSPLDLQMARIEADYVLTNNGSLGALEVQVDGLCRLLVGERAEAAA
jgi:dephospho-CoA kinase